MYRGHFNLAERPFSITPDTAFAFASRAHLEALNVLLLAIDDGEGFIKITGDIGTGKTLACRRFLATLAAGAPNDETVYLHNPSLTPRGLLLAIAQELRLPVAAHLPESALLGVLTLHLIQAAEVGRRVIVCLDEAQAMPLGTLEALRLISNLESEKRKLLQIVLFGQPELDEILATRLPQLASRITFQYRLAALSAEETESYLAYRVQIARAAGAGSVDDKPLFAPAAARLVFRATRGVPRLVNIVAHKALLLAYGRGDRQVLALHVRAAAADTPALTLATRRSGWTARLSAWMTPRAPATTEDSVKTPL